MSKRDILITIAQVILLVAGVVLLCSFVAYCDITEGM